MPEKTNLHFLAKFKCTFNHRQEGNEPLVIEESSDRRVWLELSAAQDPRARLSVLCVYQKIEVKNSVVDELRAAASGDIEPKGVQFTVELEKRTKQRFEFYNGREFSGA